MAPNERIYILGLGNLGRLFAHALANASHHAAPITLLFHRASLLKDWEDAGRTIQLTTNHIVNRNGTYDVEVINESTGNHKDIIKNLIVTTKTTTTLPALHSVRSRLTRDSTILFCQNGMGTVEEVTNTLFPGVDTRPQFLAGITSHGVYSTGPFQSVHAGQANVTVGLTGGQASGEESAQTRYLISEIVATRALNATETGWQELLYLQLEKLAVNVVLNPLTALFRCKNGVLFSPEQHDVTRLVRRLLEETSQVFQSIPETAGARERCAPGRLELRAREVSQKTAGNTSSMLQDVLAERETEIDFINGWVVRKGTELGLDVTTNKKLTELVKNTAALPMQDIARYF